MAHSHAFIIRLESVIPGAEAHGRRWPGEGNVARDAWVAQAEQDLGPIAGATEFFESRRGQPGLAMVTRLPLKAGGELIKAMGWRRIFEVYVGAEHLGAGMDDAGLYAMAIQRLRREAGECVVVENRPAGVAAAKEAGAWVWGLGRGLAGWRLRRAGADWVAADLSTIPSTLR